MAHQRYLDDSLVDRRARRDLGDCEAPHGDSTTHGRNSVPDAKRQQTANRRNRCADVATVGLFNACCPICAQVVRTIMHKAQLQLISDE